MRRLFYRLADKTVVVAESDSDPLTIADARDGKTLGQYWPRVRLASTPTTACARRCASASRSCSCRAPDVRLASSMK